MNRTLIATAILIGATTLGLSANAQTTTANPTPTATPPVTSTGGGSDMAPNTPTTLNRDVNQQSRIEQGLQNGTITTRESAELERNQARINALQSKSMHGGLSTTERAELDHLQDHQSHAIRKANANGVNGNPMSGSSQRAQAEVQRNISQQQRIQEGVRDNSLTNKEASRLEAGQARSDMHQYNAGKDGKIGENQAENMKEQDNRQSDKIYKQRHDNKEGHR
jgi:hypothetical protein